MFKPIVCLGGVLLALPFFVEPGFWDEVRMPKVKAMVLASEFLLSLYFAKKVHPILGISFFWLCFTSFIWGTTDASLSAIAIIASALGLASLAVNPCRKDLDTYLNLILWSCLLTGVYAWLQVFGMDFIFHYQKHEDDHFPLGFIGQQTLLGQFISLGVTIALFRRNWWAVIYLTPLVFLTESTFSICSLGIGFGVWFLYFFKWKRTVIMYALMGFSGFAYLHESGRLFDFMNNQGRVEAWTHILKVANKRPVGGFGIGHFTYLYPKQQPKKHRKDHGIYKEAHNEYLQVYYESGSIGIVLLILCLVVFFRNYFRYFFRPEIACAGGLFLIMCFNALGSFPFHLLPMGLIALISWVIVITYKEEVPHG